MKVSVKMSKQLREAGVPAQALAERLPGCKVFGSRVEWDDGEPEPADPGPYPGGYGTLGCLADYLHGYSSPAKVHGAIMEGTMTMTAGCAPNHWDRDYALGCDYVAEAEAEGRRFATVEEMVRWARLRVPFASVGGGRRSRPGLEHELPLSGGGDEVLRLHSPVAGRTEILYRHLDGPWKWAGECEAGDLLCRLLALVDGQRMWGADV